MLITYDHPRRVLIERSPVILVWKLKKYYELYIPIGIIVKIH